MLFVLRTLAPAVLAAIIVLSGSAFAAEEQRPCRSQSDITRPAYALPRTAQRLADRQPLTIVALGSSSTAGAGASSPDASYPNRLAASLKEHFPSNDIKVLNRGVNGEDARDMLDRFETSVAEEKPDLVLWQVGTNTVLRDQAVTPVAALIREGVSRMKALGADVILIDAQFAPRILAKPGNETMLTVLAAAAKETSVGLFPRFAVMRRWRELQNIPFEAFLSPDGLHMNDWSYACIAKLLGDAIVEATTRPEPGAQPAASATLQMPTPPMP
jgi:lysophospholipase L1-like esterase